VQLPGGVKAEDIKANFEGGMLTVDVPKAPGAQTIKVQVSGRPEKQVIEAGSKS
jgi:HSP20 family molecular chaperone IbpA